MVVKAHLLLAMGEFTEARQVAVLARAIAVSSLPADHWLVAAATSAEGVALAGLGEYAEAEKKLAGSLEGLSSAPIPDLYPRARTRLGELYLAWGRPELARKYLNR